LIQEKMKEGNAEIFAILLKEVLEEEKLEKNRK